MSKLKYLLLLLLVAIIPSAVKADSITAKLIDKEAAIRSPLWVVSAANETSLKVYRGPFTPNKSYNVYHYNTGVFEIETKDGKRYGAICVDPALYAIPSGSTVKCDAVESEAISTLLKNNKDLITNMTTEHIKLELAVRALSGLNGAKFTSSWAQNLMVGSLENRIIKGQKSGQTLLQKTGSCDSNKCYTWKGDDFYKSLSYSDADGDIIQGAVDFYNSVKGLSNTGADAKAGDPADPAEDTSGTVKLTIVSKKVDSANKKYTYVISVGTKKVKNSELKKTCEGCNVESFNYDKTTNRITAVVKATAANCKFKFNVTYKPSTTATDPAPAAGDDVSYLYLCYNESDGRSTSKHQKYVALMGPPDAEDTLVIDNDSCDDCPCDEDAQKEDVEISMCCDENVTSHVIQPLIKNIFCDYEAVGVNVEGFTNKCPDKYKEEDDNLSADNNYCELYCTERIFVTIPDAISARNGKYFTLKPVNDKSEGPYIEGKRTCRLTTKYDTWFTEYRKQSEKAVSEFNTYQENKAYQDMYNKVKENSIDNKTQYGQTGQKERSITYKGVYNYTCNGTDLHVDMELTQDEYCTTKYTHELKESDYTNVSYKQAEIKWTRERSIESYNGFKIQDATSGTADTKVTGFYQIKWDDETNCGHTSSSSVSCSAAAVSCNGVSITPSGTCYYDSTTGGDLGDVKSTFDDALSNYTSEASRASAAYSTAVGKINKLETQLDECDNYFETGGKGTAKDGDAYKLYKLDLTISFKYFQAYVASNPTDRAKIEAYDKDVPYEVSCTYNMTAVNESGSNAPAELGLEGFHYNTLNSDKIAKVKNFDVAAIKCLNNSGATGCSNTNVTAAELIDSTEQEQSQKYTSDAWFEAECTSKEDHPKSYVVYPYGSLLVDSSHSSNYYTVHDTNYYIEYSAMYGAFETYWTFTGLGHKGIFDEKFMSHNTCSGNTSDASTAGLTCLINIESELSRISGCDQTNVISLALSTSTSWKKKCCKTPSCEYESEDELTYSFKTVDSAKLFPDDGLSKQTNQEYGQNWLKDSAGVTVKNEVESRASSDDVFNENRISYEFNLAVGDLEMIKKYNASNDYKNFDKTSFTCEQTTNGDGDVVGIYNCRSNFITNFYNGSVQGVSGSLSTSLGNTKLNAARAKRHLFPVS